MEWIKTVIGWISSLDPTKVPEWWGVVAFGLVFWVSAILLRRKTRLSLQPSIQVKLPTDGVPTSLLQINNIGRTGARQIEIEPILITPDGESSVVCVKFDDIEDLLPTKSQSVKHQAVRIPLEAGSSPISITLDFLVGRAITIKFSDSFGTQYRQVFDLSKSGSVTPRAPRVIPTWKLLLERINEVRRERSRRGH